MLIKRWSVLVIGVGLLASVARSEWGNGLGYECKNPFVPSNQQSGWDCTQEKNSYEDLKQAFQGLQMEEKNGELKIVFSGEVLFAPDSSTLNASAQEEIQKLASWLKAHPGRKVRVEGFTDSTGEAKHNQTLSQSRAQEVADALSGKGVAKRRVTYLGYGAAKPVASNESEQGRQANRRVEVFIEN